MSAIREFAAEHLSIRSIWDAVCFVLCIGVLLPGLAWMVTHKPEFFNLVTGVFA